MKNITAWFFKVTNIRLIIIMCGLYLLFPTFFLPKIINTGLVGPLDLLFWYNHETLYQMFLSYGPALRDRYVIGLLTADFACPIIYGTFLALILTYIIKKYSLPFSRNIILVPYIAVVFDLIENFLLVFLLRAYPTEHLIMADIAGFATTLKWNALIIIVLFIVYLMLRGLRARHSSNLNQ